MREKANFSIKSETEYETVLGEIEELMDKGEANLTGRESDHIRNMALAVQNFDRNYLIN